MASLFALQFKDAQEVFDLIDHQFSISNDVLVELTKAFLDEFKTGLSTYNQPMAMIPSFVTAVPDGTETGTFLALDLGGTNLRVCEVVLNGDKTFSLVQQKYKVSDKLKSGEATALFDYLADSVDAFLTTHATTEYASPNEENLPVQGDVHLGLTFSFPVEQTALGSGKILTWTKGFSAKNAIGNDVVKLLQDAFDRKRMNVKCVALVNDTVGALLSRAYTAGGCIAGAIFGTGTNGAYIEQVCKCGRFPVPYTLVHFLCSEYTQIGWFARRRQGW
jgi:hexokinase